jgi:hypothetical protein
MEKVIFDLINRDGCFIGMIDIIGVLILLSFL